MGRAASTLEHASVDVKNIPSQHATCYVSMCVAQHVNFDASAWTPTVLDGHLADWNLDARTDLDRLNWTDLDGPSWKDWTDLDGPGGAGRSWTDLADLDGAELDGKKIRRQKRRSVRVNLSDPPREAFLINPRIKPLAHRDHDRDRIFSIA